MYSTVLQWIGVEEDEGAGASFLEVSRSWREWEETGPRRAPGPAFLIWIGTGKMAGAEDHTAPDVFPAQSVAGVMQARCRCVQVCAGVGRRCELPNGDQCQDCLTQGFPERERERDQIRCDTMQCDVS